MMKVVQGTFRQIPYWKLRGRFHSCGYRDQEVAEHSGIGRYTMSARMNGHQPWTSKEIVAICELLDIRQDEIGELFFPTVEKGESAWPVMRIRMCNPFQLQKTAKFLQFNRNCFIRVIHVLPGQPLAAVFHHAAVFIDITICTNAVFLADKKVIRTEAWRRMYTSCTCICCYMIA